MFNFVKGKILNIGGKIFVIDKNWIFWYEVIYKGDKKEGEFFLFPYFEQNFHTVIYFCFENLNQKKLFEKIVKIPWIWPKTAYNISIISPLVLDKILKEQNIDFLKQIPGIWPKTAKRIVLELKDTLSVEKDDNKLNWKIIKMLTNLWFDKEAITNALKKVDIEINEENLPLILK